MGRLTEQQIKEQIDRIVILIDNREKKFKHITDAFDKHGVKWEIKKLNSGDYTAILPSDEENGIPEINLETELCIERKASCDEIILNLTKGKERFYCEFERTRASIPILIEDSFENAVKGNYRSKITPKQFLGVLFMFCEINKTWFYFMEDDKYSALWIYDLLKYNIRNKLKKLK